MFEDALTLPGTGQKKFTDKPAEISAGERATALYNIACCHCKLEGAPPSPEVYQPNNDEEEEDEEGGCIWSGISHGGWVSECGEGAQRMG
jgi:hypothetical protein